MQDIAIWATPVLLLPGVGMLILSTSSRYGQIHGELHHFNDHARPMPGPILRRLRQRARLFRNALTSLYASVCCLASAAVLGHAFPSTLDVVNTLICVGVAAVLVAATFLVYESWHSYEIIALHCETLQPNTTRPAPPTDLTSP